MYYLSEIIKIKNLNQYFAGKPLKIGVNMIIALCGFMGAGKTTIGKRVSKKVDFKYIDLDDYIVEKSGKSIAQIFDENGENEFRRIESDSLKEILDNEKDVLISLGGGTLERDENVKVLKKCAKIIYISVPFNVCYTRIRNTDRPLVKSLTESQLRDRYIARDKRFKEVADIIVENCKARLATDEIANLIEKG